MSAPMSSAPTCWRRIDRPPPHRNLHRHEFSPSHASTHPTSISTARRQALLPGLLSRQSRQWLQRQALPCAACMRYRCLCPLIGWNGSAGGIDFDEPCGKLPVRSSSRPTPNPRIIIGIRVFKTLLFIYVMPPPLIVAAVSCCVHCLLSPSHSFWLKIERRMI
jgi:hypothetical protein